jgi:lipid II:glycine glycyltransferase (peptidoglycan interpeptide bridge formation enzyme)
VETREITQEERDKYNRYVADHPIGHIFQSYEWGEIKGYSGWTPRRFVIENNREIRGAFSLLERKVPALGRVIFYVPCGPTINLEDEEMLAMFTEQIKELSSKRKAMFVKLDPPIENDNNRVKANLVNLGYEEVGEKGAFEGIQPRCVMHLDISDDLDAILARMESKWRYNIRLAERKGVMVRSETTKEDLKKFYEILLITGKRDGFLVRSYDYFAKVYDTLVPKGMGKLFVAEYQGSVIAATIAFSFGKKCWYVYGASSNEYRNIMPNHALQWAMIKWAKEKGCPVYDMRGIPCDLNPDHPLHGLVRFKKGFGAKPIKYVGEYELRFSPLFSWLHRRGMPIYTKIRKLVK